MVPDLSRDTVEHKDVPVPGGGITYSRPSEANPQWLYYVAENDRPAGVGMDELLREFGLSVMASGRIAIAMKDAVKFEMAELVSPRGDPYRWRVTDRGLARLGLQARVEAPAPDPAELRVYMQDLHAGTNVALQGGEDALVPGDEAGPPVPLAPGEVVGGVAALDPPADPSGGTSGELEP